MCNTERTACNERANQFALLNEVTAKFSKVANEHAIASGNVLAVERAGNEPPLRPRCAGDTIGFYFFHFCFAVKRLSCTE